MPRDNQTWPAHDWNIRDHCNQCGYPKNGSAGRMYECLDMYQPPVTEQVPEKNPQGDTLF